MYVILYRCMDIRQPLYKVVRLIGRNFISVAVPTATLSFIYFDYQKGKRYRERKLLEIKQLEAEFAAEGLYKIIMGCNKVMRG